jgi:hypothetical protein
MILRPYRWYKSIVAKALVPTTAIVLQLQYGSKIMSPQRFLSRCYRKNSKWPSYVKGTKSPDDCVCGCRSCTWLCNKKVYHWHTYDWNNTPVRWVSKRQKTVETSIYGSELIVSRIAIEFIREVRFMLRSLDVDLDAQTLMLGDNESVVFNTSVPSSVLKKKHNAIAWLK